MVTPRPIDPDFEPATHVALHRLPVAAFGEPLGRRGGDLGQHHAHGRPNLGRAGLEEVATQSALARVVVWRRKKTTFVRVVGGGARAHRRHAGRRGLRLALGGRSGAMISQPYRAGEQPSSRDASGIRMSRPGARCRCYHRSVSPGRSPNPPCQSPGNGRSPRFLPSGVVGEWPRGWDLVPPVDVPANRHGAGPEERDPRPLRSATARNRWSDVGEPVPSSSGAGSSAR